MTADRRARILERLYPSRATDLDAARLGQVCAAVTGATDAGLMLISGDVPRGSMATTDEVSTLIEELQFALGEGPCIDGYNQDRPALEPDLANSAQVRWVAFTPPSGQGRRPSGLRSSRDSAWSSSAGATAPHSLMVIVVRRR